MGFTKKTPDSAFSNFLDDTKKAVIGRAIGEGDETDCVL